MNKEQDNVLNVVSGVRILIMSSFAARHDRVDAVPLGLASVGGLRPSVTLTGAAPGLGPDACYACESGDVTIGDTLVFVVVGAGA